jgi:hypothetical protein
LENTGSFQAGVCLFYRRIIDFNVLLQEKTEILKIFLNWSKQSSRCKKIASYRIISTIFYNKMVKSNSIFIDFKLILTLELYTYFLKSAEISPDRFKYLFSACNRASGRTVLQVNRFNPFLYLLRSLPSKELRRRRGREEQVRFSFSSKLSLKI